MNKVQLQCKRTHPDAVLPAKAGELEAGWDICCVSDGEFWNVDAAKPCGWFHKYIENCVQCGRELAAGDKILILKPGDSYKFHTGFECAIDPGYAMLLWDRSGMGANKKIHRLAGVIDCTYRGEWLVSLINLSNDFHVIKAGDKIVQGILQEVIAGEALWVDELPPSTRGAAGFGSTGS